MKKQRTIRLLAGLGLLAAAVVPSFATSITVSAGHTASALVDELLPVSTAITFSNATIGSTASGGLVSNSAIGMFGGGGAINNLPFSNGVVLTTGRLSGASIGDRGIVGPNDHVRTTHVWETPGNQRLADEFGVDVNDTGDGAILAFDFTSTSSAFSFQYMFASEEYSENVGVSLNDAFGFFLIDTMDTLDTSDDVAVNLAVLPGNTPVSINTVNNGIANAGPGQNVTYYTANPTSAPLYDIEFDGMAGGFYATKLYASASIIAGRQYRIEMVIHDVGDLLGDSAVFIGADSFVDVPQNPVPEPSTYIGALALAGLIARKLRRK